VTAFRALGVPEFRTLWIAVAVSAVGTWMQIVAQSLLVLDLTGGSAAALGAVGLAQASAFFIFALSGGGVADRFDKQRLLLITQSLLLGVAVAYGLLVQAGAIRFWMVLALVFITGSILSFDQPARGALLVSLAGKERVASAVSLQSMTFNGAAMVGPAAGGLVIQYFGLVAAFYSNALSFVPMLAVLGFRSRLHARDMAARTAEPLVRAVRSGLETVARDRILAPVVLIYAVLFFAAPSVALLLPVLGRERLHSSADQLGVLFSAYSAGAIGGALFAGAARTTRPQVRVYAGALLIWAVSLAAVGRLTSFAVILVALVVLGAAQSAISVTAISLLQRCTGDAMRGRMMSLNTLIIMGIRPLGDFPDGVLLARAGIAGATTITVLVVLCVAVLIGARTLRVRN
jgi:MFS family permease